MSEGRVYSSFIKALFSNLVDFNNKLYENSPYFEVNILLKYDEAKGEDRDEKTCGACFD
jgi:hypothetical protein